MKNKILFFWFLLLQTLSFAQNYDFSHYSVNDGVSQSVTNCIFQDSKGFMWIGTQFGINQFDGYSFKVYTNNPQNKKSLKSGWILAIAEDDAHDIWLGTKKGLHKLNPITEDIEFIDLKNSQYITNKESVFGLCMASNGELAINTPPHFHFLDPKTRKLKTYNSQLPVDEATNDQNVPIIEGDKGQFWIASTQGLTFFNAKDQKMMVFTQNNTPQLLSNNITSLFYKNKILWIGTQNGLNKFNTQTLKWQKQLENVFIRAIFADKQDRLWVGTNGSGLFCLEKDSIKYNFRQSTQTESISHDVIFTLWIDHSQNLWLGTLQAVDKTNLKPQKFRLYRKNESANSIDLLDNLIASVYKQSEDSIWIGNWGKGLNRYNRKTGIVEHFSTEKGGKNYISNNFVHAIYPYSQSELWIGTRNGIEVFNGKKFTHFNDFYGKYRFPDFRNVRVNRILKARDKTLWIATHYGAFHLDFEKNSFRHYSVESNDFKISDNQIYTVIEDNEGDIWLATTNGVNQIKPNGQIILHQNDKNNSNSLCNNYTVSLCQDSQNNIWIGTQNGISRYNKKLKKFTYFGQEQGIPSKVIYEIMTDKLGNIWIASGNGLLNYIIERNVFQKFEIADGLQSMEFNLNAKYMATDGELFVGGMSGLNSFFPARLFKNKIEPKMVFTKVEVKTEKENRQINIQNNSEIELSWKDIEFSALEFTNVQKNKYLYQMKGISNQWVALGNRRFVPFSKLAAGEYEFRVKGSNNDGVWAKTPILLKIKILPPWWKSLWAYIVYVLLAILGVYALIIAREKKLKYERDMLEMAVKKRTEEIVAQKEEIFKINESITASINYASRIQQAVLPQYERFQKRFANSMLFYRPRDIVSGDFFWFSKVETTIENGEKAILEVVIAADSTGHGVPGAFVTVIANNILDQIINKHHIYKPHEILFQLDKDITKIFRQEDDKISVNDGMDICILTIDRERKKLMFAGAKNPLCYIHKGEAQIIKGSRNAIGGYFLKEKSFESHEIEIQNGDAFYIYSDGFQDQFGGEMKSKFLARNFRELLLEIHTQTPEKQIESLQYKFDTWRGRNAQTDDIIILGLFF